MLKLNLVFHMQGTVLGPIMYLLYINDINVGISSSLRLFADDCVLYRIIESDQDQKCRISIYSRDHSLGKCSLMSTNV